MGWPLGKCNEKCWHSKRDKMNTGGRICFSAAGIGDSLMCFLEHFRIVVLLVLSWLLATVATRTA